MPRAIPALSDVAKNRAILARRSQPRLHSRSTHRANGKPLPVEHIRADFIKSVRAIASDALAKTDWYVVRAAEGGKPVPADVGEARKNIRRVSSEKTTAAATAKFDDLCRMFKEISKGLVS